MDLKKMSPAQLKQLNSSVQKELAGRERRRKRETMKEIRAIANKAGFSLQDLLASPAPVTRKKAKVKFRDPKNSDNTWTGRGRRPKWLDAALKSGKKLEDFSV